jgi:predicted exporter
MSPTPPIPRPMAGRIRASVPLLVLFLAALALLGGLLLRFPPESEVSDLLPDDASPELRFMLDQVREGVAAELLLLAIDGIGAGTDDARLAQASAGLAARLAASGRFSLVANGDPAAFIEAGRFLFQNRYLLGPVRAEDFTVPRLRADLEALLASLGGAAPDPEARLRFADPTDAFTPVRAAWQGGFAQGPRLRHGVWFAADRPHRTLLLLRLSASGTDTEAVRASLAVIRQAYAAALRSAGLSAHEARLTLAGPALFAAESETRIRRDAGRISYLAGLLLLAALALRFRHPLALAAALTPVLLGLSGAYLLTRLVAGTVHAITFGFGMTALGIAFDYPILWIGHRKPGEPVAATAARIGRSFALAAASAVIGLAAMVFSRFPGLSEIGLFAASGLALSALATRFLLAPLLIAPQIAHPLGPCPDWIRRLEALRRYRWLAALAALAALIALLLHPPRLEDDLSRLSPIPAAALDEDATLRRELGAPEVGLFAYVGAPTPEAVLAAEERLEPALAALERAGVLARADIAARLLPSCAAQAEKRAALPAPEGLAARLEEAQAGLPFASDAFASFLADVAASRSAPCLTPQAITDPLLTARLAPLLVAGNGAWHGLIVPAGLRDGARFASTLGETQVPGADLHVIDVKKTMGEMARRYTIGAGRWLALGSLALALLLAAALGPGEALRVIAPVAAALGVTLALLSWGGARLSLFHLAALPLGAGLGLDYALFFARRLNDDDERARTFRTLLLCNALAVLTFGLLLTCRTPLLREIGLTVALAALAALVFAFFFAGRLPEESAAPTRPAGRGERISRGGP